MEAHLAAGYDNQCLARLETEWRNGQYFAGLSLFELMLEIAFLLFFYFCRVSGMHHVEHKTIFIDHVSHGFFAGFCKVIVASKGCKLNLLQANYAHTNQLRACWSTAPMTKAITPHWIARFICSLRLASGRKLTFTVRGANLEAWLRDCVRMCIVKLGGRQRKLPSLSPEDPREGDSRLYRVALLIGSNWIAFGHYPLHCSDPEWSCVLVSMLYEVIDRSRMFCILSKSLSGASNGE